MNPNVVKLSRFFRGEKPEINPGLKIVLSRRFKSARLYLLENKFRF